MKNRITSIYKQADRFAEITKTFIRTGNIARAKKCLAIAEKLFNEGNQQTKSVIANTYVFSVTTFMELRNCKIANLFPQSLKKEYINQITASGV
ncbi:hypothetical protein HUK80_01695 [Flavobacterium sp. MAH-1]|uniref:DUF7674 domain-containing protein n=1 Tax=Flavobacterium agri TaxID=2743471 RepID=A0A7Y9C5W4_9FLAO|nr:hypothetical protein [Flavobacterium agri]NUY79592.1 hypothetical protein [Flavobacterium agri]NYA69617.1 hypothetical protein [Flavobacterium agri]